MSRFGLGFVFQPVAGGGNAGSGTASLSGTAQFGQTLTCTFNDNDPDGAATEVTYQWFRDAATSIGGATNPTYVLTAADLGHTVKCRVNYTDGEGFSESIFTADSAVVVTILSLQWLEEKHASSSPTTTNFTGCQFGAADANRYIIVCILNGVNTRTINSCTIGGVAATELNAVALSTRRMKIYAALVPSGADGTISVVQSGIGNWMAINTYRVVSPTGALNVQDSWSGSSSGTVGQSVAITNGGVVIGASFSATASDTYTWTFLTKNFEGTTTGTGANGWAAASKAIVSGDGSSQNITVTQDQTHSMGAVCVSLRG